MRPALINSSQSRREAIPALARTFCNRSGLNRTLLAMETIDRYTLDHARDVLHALRLHAGGFAVAQASFKNTIIVEEALRIIARLPTHNLDSKTLNFV
jgi:hypothetical protein